MKEITADGRTVTLKDLANELGIHPSTVSRILHSGSDVARGAASVATAERVRELARKRGYSPNPQAAGLRTRRTRLTGVIVPRLSDLVLAIMYEGIEEAAAELGYSTFVMNSRDDPQEQRRKTETMLARRVDGLIIGDAHLDGSRLRELTARKVPFVLMNRRVPGYPSATCDDVLGGQLAAEHLWSKGHRAVAVIAGEPYASTAVDRTAGFVDRWRSLGGRIPEEAVVWSRFDTAGGREAAETILTGPAPHPTAFFAVNDFAAIGAMGALRSHGVTVGRDVAVVGFNDTSLAAELPIPLSSVRSPMLEIGRTAMHLLKRVLEGEHAEPVLLKPTLCVRESSA
ncbi:MULTISPECIES: LacI family DNA-binding transcriptional regulator [unclassified Arthrobacter]|uniref:LacI family DNA-binding transcriptional regulator n=1 Tax=unclassified Arthrobacter TaxID=235627 RepID=UPI002DF83A3E|nr:MULTISPECIES: substrate-binding domain-containing protein [unclassified Arthrobacter]MEC5191502.1 LacI family transcriptional regulator [Arthrobacter sp. MP_M4]MEC5203085.1 LacI family transcriptional regulator [Arthrobacter sp. MP_M7]